MQKEISHHKSKRAHRLGAKFTALAVIAPGLIASALGLALFSPAASLVADASGGAPVCSTVSMASNPATWTAGWTQTSTTETNGTTALNVANYSDGQLVPSDAVASVPGGWLDPSTNASFAGSGAEWISSASNFPGDASNTEGSAQSDQWRLFQNGITVPAGATVSSATISFAADNATDVYMNGTLVGTTNGSSSDDVYGPAPASNPSNFNQVFTDPLTMSSGTSTFDFVVRNWAASASSTDNPTGLLYNVQVNYCTPAASSGETVTIASYLDGAMTTASSSNNVSFPMTSSWVDTNTSSSASSTGSYNLDSSGANSSGTAYEAVTNSMGAGSSYTTSETLDGTLVGASCNATSGVPAYTLTGYSTGTSLAAAASGTVTSTPPDFTNLQNNEYVVVWNATCPTSSGSSTGSLSGNVTGTSPYGTLAVTSITPVNATATADGTFADGWKYLFNITAPTNEPHLSMQFGDWTMAGSSSTIPVADNMRISSMQADNSDATILLTASNTYSSPALNITGDLDPSTPGNQIQVLVETAVPINTANGSYSTNYGIQTLP